MNRGLGTGRIGIEVTIMKFDSTTILFTLLLMVSGTGLLLGSQFGVVSLDGLARFWPLSIVATGLAQLLTARDKKQS